MDEEESRPGQPKVEIRRDKWDVVNGDETQMNGACSFYMKYYQTNIFSWIFYDSLH